MSFRLKNAGGTYQWMVTRMVRDKIRSIVEFYIDDMVVKSRKEERHVTDLNETFEILRWHKLYLNANKCVFGVGAGKFLGYMITNRGIEVNPDKIRAIQQLVSPSNPKDVQRLIGMIVVLNQFISRSAKRCRPLFQLLKKWKGF